MSFSAKDGLLGKVEEFTYWPTDESGKSSDTPRRGSSYGGKHDIIETSKKKKDRRSLSCLTRCLSQSSTSRIRSSNKNHRTESQKKKKRQEKLDRKNKINVDVNNYIPDNERRLSRKDTLFRVPTSKSRDSRIIQVSPHNEYNPNYIDRKSKIAVEFLYPKQIPQSGGSVKSKHKREHTSTKATRKRVNSPVIESGLPLKLYPSPNFNFNPVLTKRERFGMLWCFGSPQHKRERMESPDYVPTRDVGLPNKRSATLPRYSYKRHKSAPPKHKMKEESVINQSKTEKLIEPGVVHIEAPSVEMNCLDINTLDREDVAFEKKNSKVESSIFNHDKSKQSIHPPTYGIRSRKFSEFKESLACSENKPSVLLKNQSRCHHNSSLSDPILEEITSSRVKKMADLRGNYQIFSENILTKSNVFKNSLENELVFQETYSSSPSIQNCACLREMLAHLSGNDLPNTVESKTVENIQPGNSRSGTLRRHQREQNVTIPGSIGFDGSDKNPRIGSVNAIKLRSFDPEKNNSFDSIEICANAQSLESYDSFCPSDYNFTCLRDHNIDSSTPAKSNQNNRKYSSSLINPIRSKKSHHETKSVDNESCDIEIGKRVSLNKSDIRKYSQINRNVNILSRKSENNSNITSSESIDCYLSQKNFKGPNRESVDREINSIYFDELSTGSKQNDCTQIAFIPDNNSLHRRNNQGLKNASTHSNKSGPSLRTGNMSQKFNTGRDHSRDTNLEKNNHSKISKESIKLDSIIIGCAKEDTDSIGSKLTYDLGNVSTHSNKIIPASKTGNVPHVSPKRSNRNNHPNEFKHKTKYNESIELISEMGCRDSIKSEQNSDNFHINTNKSYNMPDVTAKSSSKNKRHDKIESEHEKMNYKTIDIHSETMGCFPSCVSFQIDNDEKSRNRVTHSNTTWPSSTPVNLPHYPNTNINSHGSNLYKNNTESIESNRGLMGCIPNYDSIQSGISHDRSNVSYHSNIRAAPLRTINMSHIVSPKSSSNNKPINDDESHHNKKSDESMMPNRENDINSLDSVTVKKNISSREYPTESTSTQFWNRMMQKTSISNVTERKRSEPTSNLNLVNPTISNRSYSERSEEAQPYASVSAKTIESPLTPNLYACKRQILTEKNQSLRLVNDHNVETIPIKIEQDINGNNHRNHSNAKNHFNKRAMPEENTFSENSVIRRSYVTSEARQVFDEIGENILKVLTTQIGKQNGKYPHRNESTGRKRHFSNQDPIDRNKHSGHSVVTMTTRSLSERRKPNNTSIEQRMMNTRDEPIASGYRERLVFSVDSNGDEYVQTIIQPLISNIFSTRQGEHRTMVRPSSLNDNRPTSLHTPFESFKANSFIEEPPVRLPVTTVEDNNYNETILTPVPVISPAKLPVRTKSAATNTILLCVAGNENEIRKKNAIPNADFTDQIDSKAYRTTQNDEGVPKFKSKLSCETVQSPFSKVLNRDQQLYQARIVREVIPIYLEPEPDVNSRNETDNTQEESPNSNEEMTTKEAYVACKCGEKIRFTVAVESKDKKSCPTCYKRIEQEFTELLNDYKEQGFKPCGCRGNISVTDLVEGYMKEETVVCTCDDKGFVEGNNSSLSENEKQITQQIKERDGSSNQGCAPSQRGSCGKQCGSSSKYQKETRRGKQEMMKFNTGKCAKNRCPVDKTSALDPIKPHVFNVFHSEGGGEFKQDLSGNLIDGCVTCRCGNSQNLKLDKMPDNVITCRCNTEELRVNSDFVGVVHCRCEETMATTATREVPTHRKLPLSRKRSTGKCHLEKATSKPSFRFRRSAPIVISDNNTQKSNRKMKRRSNKTRE